MSEIGGTKHLEMLQDAISRMAGYSFVAKGWSVTLATAILGLATKDGGPKFLWIGALSVFLFWLIDAYYLNLEKGFRRLFTAAAELYVKGEGTATFGMTPTTGCCSFFIAAFRPVVLMVHPPLLTSFLLAGYFLAKP